MCGIVSKFDHTQEAIQLIDDWSSSGDSYQGIEEIAYKVDSIASDGSITYATVCSFAKKAGADLAVITRKHTLDDFLIRSIYQSSV